MEVAKFAVTMLEKLEEKSFKPCWKEDDPIRLLARLEQEMNELREEIVKGPDDYSEAEVREWKRRISKEAADCGNFSMMISDIAGDLGD